MPQDNNNNVSKGIRVANTVAGLPYTAIGRVIRTASTLNSLPYRLAWRGIRRYNDAKLKVSKKLVERRVRNLPATAAISVGAGPILGPIVSNLALDVLTVRRLSGGQNNAASTKTNTRTKASTNSPNNKAKGNSTSNQSNGNRTSNQSGGTGSGILPKVTVQPNPENNQGKGIEVVVTAQQPNSKSVTVNSRGLANTRNRRGGSSRRLQRVNVGGGYLDKAYTPGVGVNPEMIVVSPPLGVAIPLSLELTPDIPETIEVPLIENTPKTFTRKDVRNMLRAKGINPYYEIGGLQRRALRRYLNGEPVAGEYQDFINKIMQQ